MGYFHLIKAYSQAPSLRAKYTSCVKSYTGFYAFPLHWPNFMLNPRLAMKTLTEFPGMNLKNAAKQKKDLIAAGKSAEELPQAMGEAFKVEGDKLNFLLNALEIVGDKLEDLKRALVFSLAEGEKAPPHSAQKGDQYYLVEYYPSLNKRKPQGRFSDASGRSDPADKKRKKRGRGRRGPKQESRDRNTGSHTPSPSTTATPTDQPPRERRPRRFHPKKPAQPAVPLKLPKPLSTPIQPAQQAQQQPAAPAEASATNPETTEN